MRDPKAGRKYPYSRLLHRLSGILLYIGCKAKLFLVSRIEDFDRVIYPNSNTDLTFEWVYVGYCAGLFLFWVIIILIYKVFPQKFRDKAIRDNTGQFNANEKNTHMKLLDVRTDQTINQDLSALFRGLNWVLFEDRVFDISGIDHPGGRFITETLTGKEVSRFMLGGEEYTGADTNKRVHHQHSPLALNLLEER